MKYTFYWKTGKKEVLEGKTPADAANKAGYGQQGATAVLDFYAEGEDNNYWWSKLRHKWVLDVTREIEPDYDETKSDIESILG
jgi:hypothetical protein